MQVVIDDEFVVLPLAGTLQIYATPKRSETSRCTPGMNQRWTELSTGVTGAPLPLRRLAYLIPVWLGISFVAFALANLTPGIRPA